MQATDSLAINSRKPKKRQTIVSFDGHVRSVLQMYLRENPHPLGTIYLPVLPPHPHTNPVWISSLSTGEPLEREADSPVITPFYR